MHFNFNDIVDIGKWQAIQEHLASVLKIPLRTVNPDGSFLTTPSYILRLCQDVVQDKIEGKACCCCDWKYFENKNWRHGYVCEASLHNFTIPLELKHRTIAYLLVGPVILGKPKDMAEYEKIALEMGVNAKDFLDAIREINPLSFYGMKSIVELLYDIGLYICELGYQNSKLKKVIPQAPVILERINTFYVERLLNALLQVSCSFAKAKRGSIMLLDIDRGELYIKMAKGLDQKIVDTARVALGEGLSGLVAQQQKSLFIDNNIKDEKVISRLKHPELKNAMLIPIKSAGKLLGVLSVSNFKALSDELSTHGLETLDKLTELVETTMSDLSNISLQ